jgi:hypothetical protein
MENRALLFFQALTTGKCRATASPEIEISRAPRQGMSASQHFERPYIDT